MIVRVARRDTPFVVIERAALEDERLSWKARGLLAYLLTRPDNWQVRFSHLMQQAPEGERALRGAFAELCDCGYAALVTPRDGEGRLEGRQWVIYESARQPEAGEHGAEAAHRNLQNADIGGSAAYNK